jgi:hypothetical protein
MIPVLFLLVVLLSGCLSSETEIELRDDGSGRITMRYEIDAVAFDTGAFGSEEAGRIVPVTERDFRRAEAEIPGLSLRRYRSSRSDEIVEVTAVLSFDDVDTLQRFLGADSLRIELTDEGGRWTQTLAAGRIQDEGDEALAESLEPYSLSVSLFPPSDVKRTAGGTGTGEGRSASVTIGLDDIVRATEPIIWTVEW